MDVTDFIFGAEDHGAQAIHDSADLAALDAKPEQGVATTVERRKGPGRKFLPNLSQLQQVMRTMMTVQR